MILNLAFPLLTPQTCIAAAHIRRCDAIPRFISRSLIILIPLSLVGSLITAMVLVWLIPSRRPSERGLGGHAGLLALVGA